MPNIPYQIIKSAFDCVYQDKISELEKLITKNPGLISTRLQRYKNSTLFIRACEYLRKDIIELLLEKGSDTTATNDKGNNGIMYLFYNDKSIDNHIHDAKALEILELLREKNIPLSTFIAQDQHKDTPLFEAARTGLLECSKFIISLLKDHDQNILKEQLTHKNNIGQSVFQLTTSEQLFDEMFNEINQTFTPVDAARLYIDCTIKISRPNAQKKDKLLSLTRESLSKLDIKEVKNLAEMVFQQQLDNRKFDEAGIGPDNTLMLMEEHPSGRDGVKIFNSIDVELIELLYVVGGINLVDYKEFISSLTPLKDEDLANEDAMCWAVILESNKQKILQIINDSNTLSTLAQNSSALNTQDEDMISTKNLALKRFCFLAANNDKPDTITEAEALLTFANSNHNISNVHDNLKQLLMEECKTHEKLKKALNIYGQKITNIISNGYKVVSDLLVLDKRFEEDVDLLFNELEKLLNPNLGDVLPRCVFLDQVQNKKEQEVSPVIHKFIQDNLKFFNVPHKIQIPKYEELDKNQYKASTQYYQNHPESMIPNLPLLRMSHSELIMQKLRESLYNDYTKARSTVVGNLKVITDLNSSELDSSVATQDFSQKVLKLTQEVRKVLCDPTIEHVKNANLLCQRVSNFLKITPITELFAEHSNNYQSLKEESDNVLNEVSELNLALGESNTATDFG